MKRFVYTHHTRKLNSNKKSMCSMYLAISLKTKGKSVKNSDRNPSFHKLPR